MSLTRGSLGLWGVTDPRQPWSLGHKCRRGGSVELRDSRRGKTRQGLASPSTARRPASGADTALSAAAPSIASGFTVRGVTSISVSPTRHDTAPSIASGPVIQGTTALVTPGIPSVTDPRHKQCPHYPIVKNPRIVGNAPTIPAQPSNHAPSRHSLKLEVSWQPGGTAAPWYAGQTKCPS